MAVPCRRMLEVLVNVLQALTLVLLLQKQEGASAQETHHMELPYRILEDLQMGTYVGNIFRDAGVDTRYSKQRLSNVEFRFLSHPELGFTMEEDTGILRTGPAIDRDGICPHLTTCTVQLDVVAVIPDPLQFLEIIKVNVEILDRNDNEPRFPETRLAYQVLESAMPGSSFVIPTAIDPDSGDFGIQRYELLSNTDKFELDAKPKVDGSTEVRLVTRQRLDREIQDFYQMKIFAYDGGNPPKSGSVDITVTVQDVNDNDPVFSNTTYEVAIMENTPPQNTIVRVHATDHDIGLNGQVIYGFSATTLAAYGELFGIRNATGEIYVKGIIDYEKNIIYHLSITAHDLSPDSRTADATVIIKVVDANDNAPQITVNTLAATGTDLAEIAEDADLDTFVAHITVTDPDSGRNGQFKCNLNDNHFQLREMYQSEYKIVTRAYLDREVRGQYNLAVTCRDRGIDPQVAIKHMTVKVTDINDNSPLFRRSRYQANLIENNFVGAVIAHVNATDADSGENGAILYSVEPNYQKLFKVDPLTGVVNAAVMFDHEEIQQIKFRIIASDRGETPRTSVATITVDIDDVNDESPVFSQRGYSFGVYENQPAGTQVGVVNAIDRDAPPFNQFEFTFFPTPDAIDNFVIHPKSGSITTKNVLDREEDSVYYLVVLAIDKGDPPRTSSVTVSVYVSDTNDNDPVFDFPSKTNNTIQISNMVPMGYVVTRVRAYDKDIGQNSNLTYQVTKGTGMHMFSVDLTSGDVSVVSEQLKKIEFEAFDLEIAVRDHGEQPRLAKTHLNIVVNHSIAFYQGQKGFLLGHNLMIVVSVACVTGVIVVLLIIAILALKRSGRNEKNGKYNCPKKALTLLSTNDPPKEADDNCRNKGFEKERSKKQFMMMNNQCDGSTHVDIINDCHAQGDKLSNIPSPPPPPQVHQFLQLMKQERGDADSTSSGEGSNTDSGRGPSEEGDRDHSHSKADHARDHHQPQHPDHNQQQHQQQLNQQQQQQHHHQHGPHGSHGHAQGHGTLGRAISSRPPTRATESFNGGHTPSSTGHTTLPHPPPPPMHTFGCGGGGGGGGANNHHGGPGPHGSGSPQPPALTTTTPTKRVTIAPHALIDPPGKTGSLVRAVPARIVGGSGNPSSDHHGGPHRTYGYLPARGGDPLQQRDPYLSGGYSSGGERGYHTLNPRATGNPHQVYPCDPRNNGNAAGAAHARLIHQSSDTTHGGPVSGGGGGGGGVGGPLHHHHLGNHTLPHPPHRASSLPHQPLSTASQGSQGSGVVDRDGNPVTSDTSSLQSGYALKLQENHTSSSPEISKDVVV